MTLGNRIKATMAAKKISSKAMADACGVTPSAVSSWYRTSRISKETLAQVAAVLGVSLEELITGEPGPVVLPQTGASFDAQTLGFYLDKITDPEKHSRVAHAALLVILREVDGPPPELPTPEPEPPSKKAPAARPAR